MAVITINKVFCKGCNICLSVCVKKIFVSSKKRSNYGSNMPEVRNAEECVFCGLCERLCPDGAINVEGEKNEA